MEAVRDVVVAKGGRLDVLRVEVETQAWLHFGRLV